MAWQDGFAFELTEDERLLQAAARDFAEHEVRPLAKKIDAEHWFPAELVAKMGGLGFFGSQIPEQYGGSPVSSRAYALLIEELAEACASTSIIVSAHSSLCTWPIVKFGTEQQKKTYLPRLAKAEDLGCFALSEPSTGSDAAALQCRYVRKADKFIVQGAKNWITNAPKAGVCVLFAMGDSAKGNKGISAFVHRLDHPGVAVGKAEDKLGIRGSPTASINYEQAEFGIEQLLLGEGQGFKVAMETLNGGRIGVAAQATGIARAALRDALEYAQQRKTFGKAIAEHQSIQNYLADMACRLDAARYLTLGAAARKDRGESYVREAAQAKLFASEAAVWCANKCAQIFGGYGYVSDYPAERHIRDAKITEIYEGTSEIQRLVIAAQLLKE